MTMKIELTIGTRHLIIPADAVCVILLIALWWLFFWRLFTPNTANQLSLKEGDFSGQFVAYASYQAERLAEGQIALWDPFNNGGTPFLADTQAAALYPPRLVTLALVNLSGDQTPGALYNALQLEMAAHVLFASLTLYVLLRQMTATTGKLSGVGSFAGAMVGALTFSYGGYLTGYPPLQLAILETGVWLPTVLIGLRNCIRKEGLGIGWGWLALAGAALGIALLAGHPQTDLEMLYLCAAYLAYRAWQCGKDWRTFCVALIGFGAISGCLAAAQLLPGLEFSRLSARSTNFTFDSEGNGFPLYDVAQLLFPGIVSAWSPLYFGVAGAALALLAVWKRVSESRFWLVAALVALGFAYGHNTILYDIAYTLLPGFSLFRGQERAAFVVAAACAMLAGLGTAALCDGLALPARYQTTLRVIVGIMGIVVGIFLVHWQLTPGDDTQRLGLLTLSLIMGVLAVTLMALPLGVQWRAAGALALVAFELFTFGRSSPNFDPLPALTRLAAPPLVQTLQADRSGVYRVDGARGVRENYGTLYGVMDINGTSPLRDDRYDQLLNLPSARMWEVLAVRYVLTDHTALPIPSHIISTGNDGAGNVNVHRLDDPRPFARLVYRTWIEPDDAGQAQALANPNIDVRHTVILPAAPSMTLPDTAPPDGTAEVLDYGPESFSIRVHSSTPAILDVSQVDYPGWQANLDDQPTPILRANLALMAVALPAGDHVVRFRYQPITVIAGALISAVMLLILTIELAIGAAARFGWQRSKSAHTTEG